MASLFSLSFSLLVVFMLGYAGAATYVLDNTTVPANWSPKTALSVSSQHGFTSTYPSSLCWNDTFAFQSITKSFLNKDWSDYGMLYFWMYNKVSDGSALQLVLDSDNNGGDWDYYSHTIYLNWVGWKFMPLAFSSFAVNRNPAGWNYIKSIEFAASGWSLPHSNATQVCFNGFELGETINAATFLTVDFTYAVVPNQQQNAIPLSLVNPTLSVTPVIISLQTPAPSGFTVLLSATTASGTTSSITLTPSSQESNSTVYLSLRSSQSAGASGAVTVIITTAADTTRIISSFLLTILVVAPTPLPNGLTRPFLFLDNSMKGDMVSSGIKANAAATQIGYAAQRITQDLTVPQKWGLWYGYFYCTDGTSLVFDNTNNTAFYCPSEKKYYTGWPYTQSWYTYKHNQLIGWMLDLAIGYYLTGNTTFGDAAANMLVQYSAFYPALPYLDISQLPGGSGGRLLSQTLDEANNAPSFAATFDFVYDRLGQDQKALVEYNLLRATATTIKRNNAGMSNWQSWHNAAFAAIGYAVGDDTLVDYAINNPTSGFKYQLATCISDDGFWWENSIGYHYYTLGAMQWLLSVCSRRGNDLTKLTAPRADGKGTKSIELMYSSPIAICEPMQNGWGFPALNDDHSEGTYISSEAANYLYANWQWGPQGVTPGKNQQAYSWVLGQTTNFVPRDMLYWGSPISSGSFTPSSVELSATGLSILNAGGTKDWVLLKYGPHGGFHGHYDKLELLFDHNLSVILNDYGTVQYTQLLHINYFKRTLSHNTILIDAITQNEASGNALFFGGSIPDFQVMSSNSTELIAGVAAQRTVILLPNVDGTGTSAVVDLLEAINLNSSTHDYYCVYHSSGDFKMQTGGGGLSPYTIPYTSVDPSWGYFQNAQSTSIAAKTVARYTWSLAPLTVQDGFEDLTGWTPVSDSSWQLDTSMTKEGKYSVLWQNQYWQEGLGT